MKTRAYMVLALAAVPLSVLAQNGAIFTGTDEGVTAHVKVFDGRTGGLLSSFLPYGSFTGGVRVAAGDVNGDGIADRDEEDCDADGIPDGCERDTDGDGTADDCE